VTDYMAPWAGVLFVGAVMCAGVYLVAVVDQLVFSLIARTSPRELFLGPLRAVAAAAVQRPSATERPDVQAWWFAPALLLGLAAVALAVVPFGPETAVADSRSGFVIFAAAVAFVMVAVYLHGWAANSMPSLIGGYRFIALALSYQIPFLLALLATALPAESLAVGEIVRAQEPLWNVVRQPLGLPIYLVVGVGVAFWGPLNLPDARDVGGGTEIEVSGAPLLLWRVARAAMLVSIAAMGAAAWLGGWFGPWLPGPAWMALKTVLILVVLVSSRHLFARVRLEQFVTVAWAVLIPLALVDVFVSGVLLL
jgi:NADH-quinone oxidoreductase subunit H